MILVKRVCQQLRAAALLDLPEEAVWFRRGMRDTAEELIAYLPQ